MCRAGLDSIRVSLNSCRRECYEAYFRPRGYDFEDLKESIRRMKANGRFASINYFVLPGFTDREDEFESLCGFIEETGLDLIQMRNLNIDPEWYLKQMAQGRETVAAMGVRTLMTRLLEGYPRLRFGYFNPCLDAGADHVF